MDILSAIAVTSIYAVVALLAGVTAAGGLMAILTYRKRDDYEPIECVREEDVR